MSTSDDFEPSDLAAIEAAIGELMSRARPWGQVKPKGGPRPELDPDEHAGKRLTPEERVRRVNLLARNRALNHPFRF